MDPSGPALRQAQEDAPASQSCTSSFVNCIPSEGSGVQGVVGRPDRGYRGSEGGATDRKGIGGGPRGGTGRGGGYPGGAERFAVEQAAVAEDHGWPARVPGEGDEGVLEADLDPGKLQLWGGAGQ